MSEYIEYIDESSQVRDYDGARKEALRWHLNEFIELYFPLLVGLFDWTRKPEWLDKEIGQITVGSGCLE